jgi:hypothetical protein
MVVLLVLAGAVSAFGATVTVTDIALSDVPTPGMTVFPVPAAAPWTGAKNLVFDNSAAGLPFSTQPYPTGNAWVNFPLSNSAITIHSLVDSYDPPAIGDAPGQYYTNTQGSASDPGADNRFPYNIPRPGRDCAADFSAVYFDLAQVATEFGVFLPAASNNYGQTPPANDYNYVQVDTMHLDVYVLNPGDTFATAQHIPATTNGYCPFLEITDSAGIAGVVVLQNANLFNGPTFGFMDVYSNVPEPMTLALISLGLLAVARRRHA